MYRITCEICGGHDFKKYGGIFTCKGCGVEYSASELKSMMVEMAESEIKFETSNQNEDNLPVEELLEMLDRHLDRKQANRADKRRVNAVKEMHDTDTQADVDISEQYAKVVREGINQSAKVKIEEAKQNSRVEIEREKTKRQEDSLPVGQVIVTIVFLIVSCIISVTMFKH